MIDPELIPGRAARAILIVADHASNAVPDRIELGIDAAFLDEHIAVDIGTGALARDLAARLQAPAVIARVSRLVIDCNRSAEDAGAVPEISDGVAIPGNADLDDVARSRRSEAYHEPYHAAVAAAIEASRARLLVSLHSFTPALVSRPSERPWQVGLLYNRDDRAARIAIRTLAGEGLTVGDNLPYSGAVYGYTTDRHAEPRGLPYLTFEVRQDLLMSDSGIAEWSARLARVIGIVETQLFAELETVRQ